VAIERIIAGPEKKNRVLSVEEREVVAHHEMGHALVAMALPGSDRVHKVSIIPRGVAALGYTIQRPTEERYLMTRAELEGRMMVLLGGRAAEELIFGHFSTGAADDLQKVTAIARAIVTRYGMHGELGHVVYERERENFLGQVAPGFGDKPYSEATAREIDLAVREIVADMYRRTLEMLHARESLLRESAARLLERETLGETQSRAHPRGRHRACPSSTQGRLRLPWKLSASSHALAPAAQSLARNAARPAQPDCIDLGECRDYSAGDQLDGDGRLGPWLIAADTAILAVFVVEIALRLLCASSHVLSRSMGAFSTSRSSPSR